jgi:subtilisin family serine protease
MESLKPEYEAQLQLPAAIREKIAPDLASYVLANATEDAPPSLASANDRISAIVQTVGRPSDELVQFAANSIDAGRGRAKRSQTGRASRRFETIDGFVGEFTAAQIRELSERADVLYVSPDRSTHATAAEAALAETTGTENARYLNPYANGSGVTIALLDSGVDWNHPALRDSAGNNRVQVVVDAVTGESTFSDIYGHGTAVAGVAAGRTYRDISGIATAADLISVRVLNSNGVGRVSDAIRGIDWCIANRSIYNIRVINMSVGASSVDSFTVDPLCQAVERAVAAGVVVVAAAGNNGKDEQGRKVYGAVTAPGNDPLVITVGSANTRGTSYRSDDVVNTFSSRGPTLGYKIDSSGRKRYDYVLKPDLVAPGNQVVTARAASCRLIANNPELAYPGSTQYMQLSGSSIASGVAAGAAAVLLDINPGLSPALVKAVLQYTAQPLSTSDMCEQGAGLLNVDSAVRLAGKLRTTTSLSPGDWLSLTSSLPALGTAISGQSCAPGRVIFSNSYHIWTGDDLFLKYQMIYEPGALWYGPRVKIAGNTVQSGTVLTARVKNLSGAVLSNRFQLDQSVFDAGVTLQSNAVLINGTTSISGVVLDEGVILAEGGTLADRFRTLGEGIILAEGVAGTYVDASIIMGET